MAYNIQAAKKKTACGTEKCTQIFVFGKAVLAALMFGRKYDIIPQNDDCSRESNIRTLVFRRKSGIKMQGLYRTQYLKRSTFR
jgi:hypothetical protein